MFELDPTQFISLPNKDSLSVHLENGIRQLINWKFWIQYDTIKPTEEEKELKKNGYTSYMTDSDELNNPFLIWCLQTEMVDQLPCFWRKKNEQTLRQIPHVQRQQDTILFLNDKKLATIGWCEICTLAISSGSILQTNCRRFPKGYQQNMKYSMCTDCFYRQHEVDSSLGVLEEIELNS